MGDIPIGDVMESEALSECGYPSCGVTIEIVNNQIHRNHFKSVISSLGHHLQIQE